MESQIYRRRAEDCLKLAEECPEPYVQEALRELATDFMREAVELASDNSHKG